MLLKGPCKNSLDIRNNYFRLQVPTKSWLKFNTNLAQKLYAGITSISSITASADFHDIVDVLLCVSPSSDTIGSVARAFTSTPRTDEGE